MQLVCIASWLVAAAGMLKFMRLRCPHLHRSCWRDVATTCPARPGALSRRCAVQLGGVCLTPAVHERQRGCCAAVCRSAAESSTPHLPAAQAILLDADSGLLHGVSDPRKDGAPAAA